MFNIDWEPFNGIAHRPWLMFFGLIFCIIAWAAGLFLCIFSGYNVTSENETTLVETSFVAYETSKDELHLSTPTGETYIINSYTYYNGNFDNPMLIALGEETSITNILASGNYDKLQVLDLTGRMLYDGAPAGFNEALLGEGVYIFTLFTPEGESVSYKQFVSKTTK